MNEQNAAAEAKDDFTGLTADLVAAYVSNNSIPASELPSLINSIHATLGTLSKGGTKAAAAVQERQAPAISIKKSVTADHIVCLEDGRTFKSLKRHLRAKYDMSPEQYRAKWNLPPDYPMVAPSYAAQRSELAKAIGLGVQGGRNRASAESSAESADTSEAVQSEAPKGRGRGRAKAQEQQAA